MMKTFRKNKLAVVGSGIVFLLVFTAVSAPVIAPFPFDRVSHTGGTVDLQYRFESPGEEHLFGRDSLGRDVLSRLIYGARISLWVGLTVVGISSVIGIFIGGMVGFFGGWLDEVFMRLIDIILAFPGILLAIMFVAILGPALDHVILALCLTGWVSYARLIRGQVLQARESEYVIAATAVGASSFRIIFRHILPNILAPLIVQASLGMAGAILGESSLSFLGLGVQPPQPSWGAMLNEGVDFLLLPQAKWLTIFPGLAIMLVVLGFNFIGDGLRDALDPRVRGSALKQEG